MNVIVEHLIEQVDPDGCYAGILKYIISFFSYTNVAVLRVESSFTTLNGVNWSVIATKEWKIQVKWYIQSTDWVPLHLIKESNLIEVVEFSVTNGYADKTDLIWWVSKVNRKCARFISKVRSLCSKGDRFKFGIEVPVTVKYALILDKQKANILCQDSINK